MCRKLRHVVNLHCLLLFRSLTRETCVVLRPESLACHAEKVFAACVILSQVVVTVVVRRGLSVQLSLGDLINIRPNWWKCRS